METHLPKSHVFVNGHSTPEEITARAQIVIVDGDTWTVIAGRDKLSGYNSPRPAVSCPVINTSGVTDEMALQRVFKQYLSLQGCNDVPGLLAAVQQIGAVVDYHPIIEELATV